MLFSVPNSTRTCGKRLLKHLLRSNTKSTNTDLRLGSQYLSINKVLDLDCLHLCRNYCSSASLKVNRSPVLKYLENVLKQYDEANSKVRDQLRPLVHLIEERQDILTSIAGLDELKTGEDKELKSLADEERQVYEEELELVDRQLLLELAPRNKHEDYDDVIMEVSCGAGGQEAMLFAAELLNMYEGYASYKGWRFEAIEVNRSDLGGIKSSTAMVKGKNTYKSLQYEIGVHRVQRTPATEKSGRIHTSTAAVVVMPQPTEVDITINDSDLVFETMRAGGPGGQHVNKTESAVRLTHLPSGIVIESKSDRSQIRNRELAVVKLRAQLFAIEQDKRTSEAQSMRQQQVGNRDRSEKIRTYNFNQDRITDHRASGNMHDISSFMEGGASLDRLIEKLQQVDQEKRLGDFLSSLR